MLIAVFWAALFFVVYTYLIYPVFALALGGRSQDGPEYAPLSEWPAASLIIAAHNEEAVLRAKLGKRAGHGLPGRAARHHRRPQTASTDGTDRIATEFAERGVAAAPTGGARRQGPRRKNAGCALGARAVSRVLRCQQHVRV